MRRINQLLAGVALAFVATPGVAFAQDASGPVAEAEDSGEIVVTARQREERLQDVPVAVTAIGADQLEREGALSVREAAAFAPGLNITSDAVGRAFMSIRGVGTTLIDTVQPGVGIFIDGIYQPNTSYLNNPVLDVARIEVLKGPQGTLFGNNTLGGAINVITREPTDVFTGRLVADWADPDNYQTLSGSVSGPIVEGVLRGRVAASYHTQDGFSTNTLAGGDARPLESQAFNTTLIWDAPQNARLTFNGYYNQIEGSQTAYSSPSGPTDYVADTALNFNNIATYTYTGGNLRGVFDVTGNTQMTATLAYDHKEGEATGDGDFGPIPLARVIFGENEMNTYTGELRFDTQWSDRLSTLIGIFANASDVRNRDITVLTLPTGLPLPAPPFIDIPSPSDETQDLTSQAIYANIFYDLTDTLEFSAGVRYDHQEVHAENLLNGQTTNYDASEVQPRVALTQHWSPNHMSYVSVARGFRGGGANSFGAPNPIYQGDSVWTYEIGDKFQTSDRRLTLNTAIYYNDYQHYIGQNSLTPSLIAVNLNTGDVTAYGAEVEGSWRATDFLTLQGGVTYNHARIQDDSEYFAVIGDHLPSDRILFQPDWNLYLTPTLTFPVGNGADIRFNVTAIYKGERVGSSLDPDVAPMLEGYTLINANLAYETEHFTLALWGTNLADEEYYESYLDRSLLGALFGDASPITRNLGITGDGRRIGVRVSARF